MKVFDIVRQGDEHNTSTRGSEGYTETLRYWDSVAIHEDIFPGRLGLERKRSSAQKVG